jgi:hypothetical protein
MAYLEQHNRFIASKWLVWKRQNRFISTKKVVYKLQATQSLHEFK